MSSGLDFKCYRTCHEALRRRGVGSVIDCVLQLPVRITGVESLGVVIENIAREVFARPDTWVLSFESNEPIGSTHMLYRYHLNTASGLYVGVRAVARGREVFRLLFTVPEGLSVELKGRLATYNPSVDMEGSEQAIKHSPGQVYIEYPVVYSILGIPRIDSSKWYLSIEGEVEKPLTLSLSDLYELGVETLVVDFHCVTGWSVRSLLFTGVSLDRILSLSGFKRTAKWVYVESLDGYSTVFPLEEAIGKKAIVALEMNGRPLDPVHGYPARLIVPHLYGWKSAKWISKIALLDHYKDGYWEALGYHPRGRVDLEERFKRV